MGIGFVKGFKEAHPSEPTSNGFCCVVLAQMDRIFVQRAPDEVTHVIREAIAAEWPSGLQFDDVSSSLCCVHEFKLKGTPWFNMSTATASCSRKLIFSMIEKLKRLNWALVEDVDVNRGNFTQLWILQKLPEALPETTDLLVSLHDTDDVRLYTSDVFSVVETESAVRRGIELAWKIDTEGEENGWFQFKLKGRPWRAYWADSVPSRQILLGVCSELDNSLGYELTHSVISSCKFTTKSSLVFRKRQNDDKKADDVFMYTGLSMHGGDLLRLLDIPGTEPDAELIDAISDAIRRGWPRGIKSQDLYAGSYEWKLQGWPWRASGEATVDSRRLVSFLLQMMWSNHFELMPRILCSGRLGDSSLLVFRRRKPANSKMYPSLKARTQPVVCVSFHDRNDIRISSTDSDIPAQLGVKLRPALTSPALFCDVVKTGSPYGQSYQYVLQASPFLAFSGVKPSTFITSIVLSLIDAMANEGWTLRTSLDVSQKFIATKDTQKKLELDSLFFTPQIEGQ